MSAEYSNAIEKLVQVLANRFSRIARSWEASTPGEQMEKLEKILAIRNVAGEMLGAMYAVKWAMVNGYKEIELRYDYEGIEKWVQGIWKAKNELAQKYAAEKLILLCIAAYFGIAVFAMFLASQAQFWILAFFVGMFQGGIQALSRSYFAKIIPPSQSGEYFGLLDICGKGASFIGTTLVSFISQLTGKVSMGVGMIAVMFLVGICLFQVAVRAEKGN